ncbi:MAG: hypothetical protein AB1899_00290 [Pseudomonadota bacterium]
MIRSRFSPSSSPPWLALLLGALLLAGPARAQELGEGLQAHGFISQVVTHSSDNQVGGDSDDGLGWGLREMGANLSWRPTPDWLLSGQVLGRWAGETDDGGLRLDYGFIDRTLVSDGVNQMGLRVGKIKNPYGFFNTTRDVAHTRPGIIMPQSIYLDRIRNFILSAPGAALHGNLAANDMDISWSLGMVQPDTSSADLESLFLLSDRVGKMKGDWTWLGQVMADFQGGRWRAGLTLGDVRMHYQPGGDPLLASGDNRLTPIVLSLEHNAEKYSLTAEYTQARHENGGYGASPLAVGLQKPNTVEGWYVQATYRPSLDWRFYVRRDEVYLDRNDRYGKKNPSPFYPPFILFAKDWTVGVRHDWNAWEFSLEYHDVKGTLWLSPLDTAFGNQTQDWDMVLLQAAWRF